VDRTEKAAAIAALHRTLQETQLVVVTHQLGLTVAEVTNLRGKMRAAGAGFKVTKNRLARIALKGTQFEGIDDLFTGPTAIAFSRDPGLRRRSSPTSRSRTTSCRSWAQAWGTRS
jgi:large subunit ribosomal protein L10